MGFGGGGALLSMKGVSPWAGIYIPMSHRMFFGLDGVLMMLVRGQRRPRVFARCTAADGDAL